MPRKAWLDFLVYLGVRVLVSLVQALPLDTCVRLSKCLAWLFAEVLQVRGKVVDENLRHAFPGHSPQQRQAITRGMWEHLFLLGIELAHAPRKIHWTNWRDYLDLSQRQAMVRFLFDERPLVLVSAHYGNFELCGYTLGILGFASFTIARPLDNPYLNRFVNQFRGAQGQFVFPKVGIAQQVDQLLARGGTLALLADQHAGDRGCWVDFFGRPASTHKAIALFALTNDAPLVVCYSQRLGAPLTHRLGGETWLDPRTMPDGFRSVPALTAWYTGELEKIIRRAPEQYWWLHRRWKGEPPAIRKKRAA